MECKDEQKCGPCGFFAGCCEKCAEGHPEYQRYCQILEQLSPEERCIVKTVLCETVKKAVIKAVKATTIDEFVKKSCMERIKAEQCKKSKCKKEKCKKDKCQKQQCCMKQQRQFKCCTKAFCPEACFPHQQQQYPCMCCERQCFCSCK